MNCGSCDFWVCEIAGATHRVAPFWRGACHRRAPIVTPGLPNAEMFGGDTGYWPRTAAENFCGDYERHPTRRLAE